MIDGQSNPRLDRVGFELRASGVKANQTANPLRSGIHHRGYLPHVKRENARYFVTFRLADSLPNEVLLKIQAERAARLTAFYTQQRNASRNGTVPGVTEALVDIEREYFRKIEAFMDKGHGTCWLRRRDVAKLAADALRFFEGQRYVLKAWVIMPNHVHVVFWPLPNHTLSSICQSWKRYIAREANKLLGRTGESFWQPESFDHWIRSDEECARCCRYIVFNPVKSRLCNRPEDWPWSSAFSPPPAS